MKIIELFNNLKDLMPEPLPWDNDGISFCPNLNAQLSRVLCTLDVTLDTVEYAAANGFDVILSHHPLMFNPPKSVTEESVTGRRIIELAKHGITAIAFHTRLDLMKGGVNDTLFALLGLKNLEIPDADGLMRIGEYDGELTLAEFADIVKARLNLPHVICTGNKPVKRVCLVGGAGNETEMVYGAIAAGADTYITGELKYHQLVDAGDMGVNLVAAGHYYTEFPVTSVLEKLTKQVCPGVYTEIYDSNRIEIK